jgi:hypothetical protein
MLESKVVDRSRVMPADVTSHRAGVKQAEANGYLAGRSWPGTLETYFCRTKMVRPLDT